MTRRMPGLLLTVLLAGHGMAVAEIVRDHPNKHLAANVAEVVAKINGGDPAQLERFVRERYAPEMLRGMTVEATATFLKAVHDGKSPLELCCYQLSDRIPENMAVAILHAGARDTWSSLQIRFDESDRINSFMIVPCKPPAGFVDLKKLDDAGLAREFDAFLTELAANDEFAGVVLVARDGKPLFTKAYGLANREHEVPNRADTRFRLGSMNKMVTAVAIAQLADQGKLSLDDPIGEHLPPGWVEQKIGRQVRIRQLLNHTSGLGDYLDPVLEQALYKFSDLEDYKEIVAKDTLSFEPGSEWAYSNTGLPTPGGHRREGVGHGLLRVRPQEHLPPGRHEELGPLRSHPSHAGTGGRLLDLRGRVAEEHAPAGAARDLGGWWVLDGGGPARVRYRPAFEQATERRDARSPLHTRPRAELSEHGCSV